MGWTGTIINGVLLGGLYGLFGVGLALVFGVTRIVNIMHGEFIALSAFIALGISSLLPDAHPLLLIVPVVIVSFALGFALQALFVNRVMRLPDPLAPLLLTFGLSVIVRNLMIEAFGVNPRHIRQGDFAQLSIDVFGIPIGVLPLVTLALAVVLFLALAVCAATDRDRPYRSRHCRQQRDGAADGCAAGLGLQYRHGSVVRACGRRRTDAGLANDLHAVLRR